MKTPKHKTDTAQGAWDAATIQALIDELWAVRQAMLARQARLQPHLGQVDAAHRASAVNLAHYLALRHIDLRHLQDRLAWMGVSSLGRAESHVMANLDKVLGILHRIAGQPWTPMTQEEPAGFLRGTALLEAHAETLFGPPPKDRRVRIMVTLPSEAAHDDGLVDGLVAAGMDIARINCAHDGPAEWARMASSVRRSAQRHQRAVRVLMDLGGPKLRTGPVDDAPAVLKLRPERDSLGRVSVPALLGLRPAGSTRAVDGAHQCLGVAAEWLAQLAEGDCIDLDDARGARRRLTVQHCGAGTVLVSCDQTTYLTHKTRLKLQRIDSPTRKTSVSDIPAPAGRLHLQRGDRLDLVDQGLGHGAVPASKARKARPATIACTLPEVLRHVRVGDRIWFDDGHIGGVARRCSARKVELEITDARTGGEHLGADKGINFPDTALDLPALTDKDKADLSTVVQHADLVGMSFAQSASDVQALRGQLVALGATHIGLILKIETQRGFEHLPEMLLAAMAAPSAGVMIARGDLAVECGYERMAEVQEEILWACEAAHMPVVWATQVLESLAKTGLPSRAEITDAAMGGRAECVMLNKGPHILDAMRTLDDILRRMQAHQSKKRPLLRALKSWDLPLEPLALPRLVEVPRPARRRAAKHVSNSQR